MKKILAGFVFGLWASSAGLFAQSIFLTNTFGGNADNSAVPDFLQFDDDGNKGDANIGDRIQLDVASEHIDSRIRLDLNISDADNTGTHVRVLGYANWRPLEGINFIGGNKFFAKWALPGAYFAAVDDFPNNGKLADDNGAGFVFDKAGFKAAAAVGSRSSLDLNFGASYDIEDVVSLGVTAQDVTTDAISLSGYARLLAVENLLLDLGYSYNYNGGYLQNTQHAIQGSIGYTIEDANLSLYADVLVGLNNKVYSSDADDTVDLEDDGVPLYTAARLSYGVNENLTLSLKGIVQHVLSATDAVTKTEIYPYFDYDTKGIGVFRTGARFIFDDDNGYKGFNIPLSWQYKIGVKN